MSAWTVQVSVTGVGAVAGGDKQEIQDNLVLSLAVTSSAVTSDKKKQPNFGIACCGTGSRHW